MDTAARNPLHCAGAADFVYGVEDSAQSWCYVYFYCDHVATLSQSDTHSATASLCAEAPAHHEFMINTVNKNDY